MRFSLPTPEIDMRPVKNEDVFKYSFLPLLGSIVLCHGFLDVLLGSDILFYYIFYVRLAFFLSCLAFYEVRFAGSSTYLSLMTWL